MSLIQELLMLNEKLKEGDMEVSTEDALVEAGYHTVDSFSHLKAIGDM